jgi:hypothetical protein
MATLTDTTSAPARKPTPEEIASATAFARRWLEDNRATWAAQAPIYSAVDCLVEAAAVERHDAAPLSERRYANAFSDLEPKIRYLTHMSEIARDLINNGPCGRITSEMSRQDQDEIDRTQFAVAMAADMATALNEFYLNQSLAVLG